MHVKKFLKKTVLKISGATFVALASLLVVSNVVEASTTYQTPNADQNHISSASAFAYKIPSGVTFDRVQVYADDSFGSIFWIYTYNPVTGGIVSEYEGYAGATYTWTQVDTNVYEVVLPTAETMPANGSLFYSVPAGVGFGVYNGSTGYVYDGVSFNSSLNYAPTIKLCNGACDGNSFSPIPTLTASPWARLTFPEPNSVINTNQQFTIQVNTGTTTADNALVRVSSSIQSFIPFEYELTQTGINSFTYQGNFPTLDDTISIEVDLRASTTVLTTSPTYTFFISQDGNTLPSQVVTCDNESGLSWAICKVMTLLFVPSEESVDRFFSLEENFDTKFPFVYVTQMNGVFDSLYNQTSTAVSSISVHMWGQELTLISKAMIEAFPLQSELRYLLGLAIYILTALYLYRRTIKIFNQEPV